MSQTIPDRIVRDCLTMEETDLVKSQSRNGQIALVSFVSGSDDRFAGYFPLNAGIPTHLKPERLDDGSIVIFGVVAGG